MKKNRPFLCLLGMLLSVSASFAQNAVNDRSDSNAPIHCFLKGEVIDRPQSDRILLTKSGGDARVNAIDIPIKNGKFEYELNCHVEETYQLIFQDEHIQGNMRPISFFAESGTVRFILHPKDLFFKNEVVGGKLNQEVRDYQLLEDSLFHRKSIEKEWNTLRKENRWYTEAFIDLRNKKRKVWDNKDQKAIDSLDVLITKMEESGKAMTPEAIDLEKRGNVAEKAIFDWEMQYIKDNTSLVSYQMLINKINRASDSYAPDFYKKELPRLTELYHTVYAPKYPTHPFTDRLKNVFQSASTIKIGGKFIDFTAPDFNGKAVKLSDQVKGKVALIDLWASWCGPCRRSAISMIPVYETYKNKGFTIVGVARESELSDAVNAANKDKYPWLNLIELKDEGSIWAKYGVGNGGGGTFLIDKEGNILAISPTAEEVKAVLEKILKN